MLSLKLSAILFVSTCILGFYSVPTNAASGEVQLSGDRGEEQTENTEHRRVKLGQNTTLSCSMKSTDCQSNFKWIKVGEPDKSTELKKNSAITYPNSLTLMQLTFAKVTHENNGTYECSCTNGKGEFFKKERSLIVIDAPVVEIVSTKAVGFGEVYVNWRVNDNNDPITSYLLEYQKHDPTSDSEWQKYSQHIPTKDTSAVVEDLEDGVKYKFRIMAINSAGKSRPAYDPAGDIMTTNEALEYIPDITVANRTNETILIEIKSPPKNLKSYNYYYIISVISEAYNSSIRNSFDAELNKTTVLIQDLRPETSHKITASACLEYNEKCGLWSNQIEVKTLNDDYQGASSAAIVNSPSILMLLSYSLVKYIIS